MRACVWDGIVGQQRVAGLLRSSVESGRVSHAYLFAGPPGAGKRTAALALTCALVCDDACGVCEACRRAKRGIHPDVRIIDPEGAAGYLVEQVREEIIRDVYLRPLEARHKVYIIGQAEMFNASSANAFLRTLEEPPEGVVIILLASDMAAVAETIVSRCQVVRFAPVPERDAMESLVAMTGAGQDRVTAAMAATGGAIARAAEFLRSLARSAARDEVLRVLKDLSALDSKDVLDSAGQLLAAARVPLDELRERHAEEVRERSELLGPGARQLRPLEERHKRELTAREREGLAELLNVAESWLRDCLALSSDAAEVTMNRDDVDSIAPVAAVITPGAAVRAIRAVNEARRRLSANVSPQLVLEAMLLDIREVLICPR